MVEFVGKCSSTIYSIIFIHWFILHPIWTLYCRNCTRIGRFNSGIETVCHTDCEGDICGIVLWRNSDDIHIYERSVILMPLLPVGNAKCCTGIVAMIFASCISGVDLSGIKMGCRRNNAGATLCLCRDFHECNDIAWQEKLAQMLSINLPDLVCYETEEINTTKAADIYKTQKCRANYCLYEHYTNTYVNSEVSTCTKSSQYLFDIDLFPRWPAPFMFPSECFLIETEPGNPVLRCMCDEDNCNMKPLYHINPGNVTCAIYDLESDDDETLSCAGHYCFIQRSHPPYFGTRESRGCLSVSDSDYSTRVKTGYQNIMGLEQWLCTDDYCNADINAAEKSAKISAAASQQFNVNIATLSLQIVISLLIVLYKK